jgi:hypothetical protein
VGWLLAVGELTIAGSLKSNDRDRDNLDRLMPLNAKVIHPVPA